MNDALKAVLDIGYYVPDENMTVLQIARAGGWNSAIDHVRKVLEDAGVG